MRNTYNIKPQRTAGRRTSTTTPRASNFEAFNTRCGKPASSLEITKYYGMIADTTLIDKYVTNYVEPVWDEEVQVYDWDELKAACEGLLDNIKRKVVLLNDILVPVSATTITVPNVDNAILKICSDTGRFTIDLNYLNTRMLNWINPIPSGLNVEFHIESVEIINGDSPYGIFVRNVPYVFINDAVFSYSQSAFYGNLVLVAVTNTVFHDLTRPTVGSGHGNALELNTCQAFVYNCAFSNCIGDWATTMHFFGEPSLLSMWTRNLQLAILGCYFEGNKCSNGRGGCILANAANGNLLFANSVFRNNSSTTDAGALVVVVDPSAPLPQVCNIFDCEFSDNIAGISGGAISWSDDLSPLTVSGDTCITGNTAGTNGGAISLPSYAGLLNLTVESSVTFANNIASSAYYLSDADKADYATHVLTTKFSDNFQYGWNNYDIGYQRGTKLEQVTVPVDQCTQDFTTNNVGQIIPFPMIDPSCVPPMQLFKGWFKDAAHTVPVSDYTIFFSGDVLYPLFVPEPDCLCCDCLNDELKNAFEMLTVSVGGTHDAAGYILQVIADKLTDPANTCELSDFQNILDELTKLTGYNQKEICCILSAMTGMEVG